MRIGPDAVAVVTGAAHGIGRALRDALVAREASTAALDVDAPGLATVAAGAPHLAVPCDVADADARAAATVERALGPPALVVACAGVAVAGPVEALTLAQLERAMAVNYRGVVHTARAFLPALRAEAARGRPAAFAVVLSDFALFTLPTKAAYAASKHAAHAFTLDLAAELAGSGVRVTAVYPGATATGLVARGEAVDPAQQARERAFLARGAPPAAVARAVLRGVERGRARVLVGADTRLPDAQRTSLPGARIAPSARSQHSHAACGRAGGGAPAPERRVRRSMHDTTRSTAPPP